MWPEGVGYKINYHCVYLHNQLDWLWKTTSCSDLSKNNKVMQPILKEPPRNLESVFAQPVKTAEACYHHLFETFRDEILRPDVETGTITDANLNSLPTFSKLNEIPFMDLAIRSKAQLMGSEDKLFLLNFDPNSTEKNEDISLAGFDQLPTVTRERA
jgi:hypothetical protein